MNDDHLDPELDQLMTELRHEALSGPPPSPSGDVSRFIAAGGAPELVPPPIPAMATMVVAPSPQRSRNRRLIAGVMAAALVLVTGVVGVTLLAARGDNEVVVRSASLAETESALDGADASESTTPTTSATPTTAPLGTTSDDVDQPDLSPDGLPEFPFLWPEKWPNLDDAIVLCDERVEFDPDVDDEAAAEQLREALRDCHEALSEALSEAWPELELPPIEDLPLPPFGPDEFAAPEGFFGPRGLFGPDGPFGHEGLDGEQIDPEQLDEWLEQFEPKIERWFGELDPEVEQWFDDIEPKLEDWLEGFEKDFDLRFREWDPDGNGLDELDPELRQRFQELEPSIEEWMTDIEPLFDQWFDGFEGDVERWFEDLDQQWRQPADLEEGSSA